MYVIQVKHPDSEEWQDTAEVSESFTMACRSLERVEKYTPHITLDDLYLAQITHELPKKPRFQIVWENGR